MPIVIFSKDSIYINFLFKLLEPPGKYFEDIKIQND